MFMTLLHFTMSLKDLVVNLVGLSMMGLVAVGYKTKLVSLVMVCWLLALNCLMNDFWRHRSTSIMWDFKKYDFFQVNRLFMVARWNHTERLSAIFTTQIVSPTTLSNRREWLIWKVNNRTVSQRNIGCSCMAHDWYNISDIRSRHSSPIYRFNKPVCAPYRQNSWAHELNSGNRPILGESYRIVPTCVVSCSSQFNLNLNFRHWQFVEDYYFLLPLVPAVSLLTSERNCIRTIVLPSKIILIMML